jgi:SH3-like domain-containing protein
LPASEAIKIGENSVFLWKLQLFIRGGPARPETLSAEVFLRCYADEVPKMNPSPSHSPLRRFFSRATPRGLCRRVPARWSARGGSWTGVRAGVLATGLCLTLGWIALLSGCSRLHSHSTGESVYVTAKQTFLRDRVAAVSNRTGTVENGQKLEVLDHGRRFYRVKTEKGEVGWIDEKAVATENIFDQFKTLAKTHKNELAVASAVVQDEVNMHLRPGRSTEVFYRLAEGEKLQLLERATLPKPVPGGAAPMPSTKEPGDGAAAPPPIAMEDWWLARDAKGRVGWLLSRMLEVDAPDTLTRYAEGQRIVGAYVLTTVYDPEAEQADKNIPIYVTVMSPYQSGLPYDFDQVRVFTWNTKMHRYETAYREKNIEGYLPVTVKMSRDPYGKVATAQTPLPTFTYKVLAADAGAVVPDPTTGMMTPGRTIEKTYRLEGNLVRRIQAAGSPPDDEAHPVIEDKKDKNKKGKKK